MSGFALAIGDDLRCRFGGGGVRRLVVAVTPLAEDTIRCSVTETEEGTGFVAAAAVAAAEAPRPPYENKILFKLLRSKYISNMTYTIL
jgi:hypothetical protein